jgi:proteasome activator subunit 4
LRDPFFFFGCINPSCLQAALDVTVNQLSPQLHRVVIQRISNFVSSNVIPNATKAMGYLVAVCGGSDPVKKVDAFIPLTTSQIFSELENGAASTPSNPQSSFPFDFSSLSDASLHWNQYAFINAMSGAGSSILKYSKEISQCIEQQIAACKSYRGVKWATKSLRVVLGTLTTVYPAESRCVDEEQWSSPGTFRHLR